MASRRVEDELNLRKMMLEDTWKSALIFEAEFAASDHSDWYQDAKVIRGGFAMSSSAEWFLPSFTTFAIANIPIRQNRRRLARAEELEKMMGERLAEIKAAVSRWESRAEEAGVTLPIQSDTIQVALFADAEFRDLYAHLRSGALQQDDFHSKVAEVMERFKISPAELSEWQDSQGIHF